MKDYVSICLRQPPILFFFLNSINDLKVFPIKLILNWHSSITRYFTLAVSITRNKKLSKWWKLVEAKKRYRVTITIASKVSNRNIAAGGGELVSWSVLWWFLFPQLWNFYLKTAERLWKIDKKQTVRWRKVLWQMVCFTTKVIAIEIFLFSIQSFLYYFLSWICFEALVLLGVIFISVTIAFNFISRDFHRSARNRNENSKRIQAYVTYTSICFFVLQSKLLYECMKSLSSQQPQTNLFH